MFCLALSCLGLDRVVKDKIDKKLCTKLHCASEPLVPHALSGPAQRLAIGAPTLPTAPAAGDYPAEDDIYVMDGLRRQHARMSFPLQKSKPNYTLRHFSDVFKIIPNMYIYIYIDVYIYITPTSA